MPLRYDKARSVVRLARSKSAFDKATDYLEPYSVMYGISTCDVTRKFLYQSKEQATDIAAEDFYARKELIERAYPLEGVRGRHSKRILLFALVVQKWEEDRPRDKGDTWEWTPILYYYEVSFPGPGCRAFDSQEIYSSPGALASVWKSMVIWRGRSFSSRVGS